MTDSAASVKRIKDMINLLDQKVDDDYTCARSTSSLLITSLTLKVIAIGAVITIALVASSA
jgi:hypothetical protein